MARTCIRFRYNGNQEAADNAVKTMLKEEGFKEKEIRREMCWTKGIGLISAVQAVKAEYTQDEVLLFGWLLPGLGSLSGAETNLSGLSGIVPKRQLLKILNKIQQAIEAI